MLRTHNYTLLVEIITSTYVKIVVVVVLLVASTRACYHSNSIIRMRSSLEHNGMLVSEAMVSTVSRKPTVFDFASGKLRIFQKKELLFLEMLLDASINNN